MKAVTDPAILAQLNADSGGLKPVTDPAILAQLNGESEGPAPRWDIGGDIGRAFDASVGTLKQDWQNVTTPPTRQEMGKQTLLNPSGYDQTGKLLSAAKLPLDALGAVTSPITGAIHGIAGSALSYVTPTPSKDMDVAGHHYFSDPKKAADQIIDESMMGLGPRGMGTGEALVTASADAAAANAARKAATLKNRAIAKVNERATADGLTPQQVRDEQLAASAGGDKVTLMDMGDKNVRGLAGAVYRAPGPAGKEIDTFLKNRDAAAAQSLTKNIQTIGETPGTIRAFHGTGADFNQFDPTKSGANTGRGRGTGLGYWFSTDKDAASIFARKAGTNGKVIPVELNITNPYTMTNAEFHQLMMKTAHLSPEAQWGAMQGVKNDLKARGFDGIKIPEQTKYEKVAIPDEARGLLGDGSLEIGPPEPGSEGAGDRFVAFDSSQAKKALGGSTYSASQDLLNARSAAARPAYDAVESIGPVHSDRLQEFMGDPEIQAGLKRGLKLERQNARAENRPFKDSDYAVTGYKDGNLDEPIFDKVPTMKSLIVANEGLGAQIADMVNPATGRITKDGLALKKYRDAFQSELDDLSGGKYKAARDTWSGPAQSMEALSDGRAHFTRSESNEQLKAEFDALSPGDKDFYRMGAAEAKVDQLERAPDASDKSKRVINSERDRKRFSMLFDSPAQAQQFIDSVARKRQAFETQQAVKGNSATAGRIAEDADHAGGTMFKAAGGLMSAAGGNLFHAAKAAYEVKRDLGLRNNPEFNSEIAKLLMDHNIPVGDMSKGLIPPIPVPAKKNSVASAAIVQALLRPPKSSPQAKH